VGLNQKADDPKGHLTLLEVMDIPHRELPPDYFTEEFMRIHGDKMLCLLLLAQKQHTGSV
jgi:hypothetical protein